MTENELSEAVAAMMPHAVNVVGFHDLLTSFGANPTPEQWLAYQGTFDTGALSLARDVFRLFLRLQGEGIDG